METRQSKNKLSAFELLQKIISKDKDFGMENPTQANLSIQLGVSKPTIDKTTKLLEAGNWLYGKNSNDKDFREVSFFLTKKAKKFTEEHTSFIEEEIKKIEKKFEGEFPEEDKQKIFEEFRELIINKLRFSS